MTRKDRIAGVAAGVALMMVGGVLTWLTWREPCQNCDQVVKIYNPVIGLVGLGTVVYVTGLYDYVRRRYRVIKSREN